MGQIGAKSVDINDTVRKSNTFSCTHEQLYLINTVFLDINVVIEKTKRTVCSVYFFGISEMTSINSD